jgi:hypothetical protein
MVIPLSTANLDFFWRILSIFVTAQAMSAAEDITIFLVNARSRHSRNCFGQTSMGLTARIVAGIAVVQILMNGRLCPSRTIHHSPLLL